MAKPKSKKNEYQGVPVSNLVTHVEAVTPEQRERIPFVIQGMGAREGTFYNPDDLVGRKGLEIYEKMGIDDQVAAALEVKKQSRMASGWEVIAASPAPKDQEIRDFVVWSLSQLPGSFDRLLLDVLSGLQYGFSICEKNWMMIDGGRWRGKLGYKSIKNKSPFIINFRIDEYGNLLDEGIELAAGGVWGTTVRTDKCAIWAHNAAFGNPYGKSDLRPAHRSWFSKDFIIKYFNLYIERFASPTLMATVPDHYSLSEINKLEVVLRTYQNQTAIIVKEGVKISFEEPRLGGSIAFRFADAIDMHNKFISRSVLVPDLMGYSGSIAGGSFALGKKQIDVFFQILRSLGIELEQGVVGEQIIRPLVDLNFPGVEDYPVFRFRDIEADLGTRVKILQLMMSTGMVDPREDWIRGYLDLPEEALPAHKAEMFTALENLQKERGWYLGSRLCKHCLKETQREFVVAEVTDGMYAVYHHDCWANGQPSKNGHEVYVSHGGDVRVHRIGTRKEEVAELADVQQQADFEETLARELTPFERGTPFKAIRSVSDGLLDEARTQARQVFGEIRDNLVAWVRKRQVVARKDMASLDKLPVNVGALTKLLHGLYLTEAGNGAVWAARDVLRRGAKAAEYKDQALQTVARLMTPQDARRYFSGQRGEERGVVCVIDLARFIDEYFAQRAYMFAGGEKEWITQRAREILGTAIRQGDPRLAEEQLYGLFDAYIGRGDAKPGRLDNLLSTAIGEALNEGRRSVFESDTVRPLIVAYMWSAVIDGRTTEYCRKMDRQIFRAEQVASLVPPAHYRCRSVLIPLFAGDEFEFTKLDPLAPAPGVGRAVGFCAHEQATS